MSGVERYKKGARVVVIGAEGEQNWTGVVDGYRFNYLAGGTDIVLVPDTSPCELRFLATAGTAIRPEGSMF